MDEIHLPSSSERIGSLKVGDKILLTGKLYTGRDATLPKLVKAIKAGECPINLKGAALMHTAVSEAGISPTSSNKDDIEGNIPFLASSGVLVHVGKGFLKKETIKALAEANAIFVVTPPVSALLTNRVKSKRVVAFKEEGIEALFELDVEKIPGIVAVAHGESIY